MGLIGRYVRITEDTCNKIIEPENKSQCMLLAVIEARKPELCARIVNEYKWSDCFLIFVRDYKANKNLCEMILLKNLKQDCLSAK